MQARTIGSRLRLLCIANTKENGEQVVLFGAKTTVKCSVSGVNVCIIYTFLVCNMYMFMLCSNALID